MEEHLTLGEEMDKNVSHDEPLPDTTCLGFNEERSINWKAVANRKVPNSIVVVLFLVLVCLWLVFQYWIVPQFLVHG